MSILIVLIRWVPAVRFTGTAVGGLKRATLPAASIPALRDPSVVTPDRMIQRLKGRQAVAARGRTGN